MFPDRVKYLVRFEFKINEKLFEPKKKFHRPIAKDLLQEITSRLNSQRDRDDGIPSIFLRNPVNIIGKKLVLFLATIPYTGFQCPPFSFTYCFWPDLLAPEKTEVDFGRIGEVAKTILSMEEDEAEFKFDKILNK